MIDEIIPVYLIIVTFPCQLHHELYTTAAQLQSTLVSELSE